MNAFVSDSVPARKEAEMSCRNESSFSHQGVEKDGGNKASLKALSKGRSLCSERRWQYGLNQHHPKVNPLLWRAGIEQLLKEIATT